MPHPLVVPRLQLLLALAALAAGAAPSPAGQRQSLDLAACVRAETVVLEVVVRERLADPRDRWITETMAMQDVDPEERKRILAGLEAERKAGTVRDLRVAGDNVTVTRARCLDAFYRVAVRRVYTSPRILRDRRRSGEYRAIAFIQFSNPCPLPGESLIGCSSSREFALRPGETYLVLTETGPEPTRLPYAATSCDRAEERKRKREVLSVLRSAGH